MLLYICDSCRLSHWSFRVVGLCVCTKYFKSFWSFPTIQTTTWKLGFDDPSCQGCSVCCFAGLFVTYLKCYFYGNCINAQTRFTTSVSSLKHYICIAYVLKSQGSSVSLKLVLIFELMKTLITIPGQAICMKTVKEQRWSVLYWVLKMNNSL